MKHIKHLIGASILIAIFTVALGFLLQTVQQNMPQLASRQGVLVDWLFTVQFWLIAFFFSLIAGLLLYSVIVFRRRKGDEEDGDYIEGNTPLEVIWTVIPLGLVLYLAFTGGAVLARDARQLV